MQRQQQQRALKLLVGSTGVLCAVRRRRTHCMGLPLAQPQSPWCPVRGLFADTAAVFKDVRKGDRGDARRLSFAERAERRMGKTKEQRESKEALLQEAQLMVNEDFPHDLQALYERIFEKANVSAMKVLNMAKCLELLEVEMSGGHGVLLTKVAQVIKVSESSIEITPKSSAFGGPILQKVSRFDATLQVSKEGPKVKVVIPPVTTARRDKTVSEIAALTTKLRAKAKQLRTNAAKVLQDCGLDDGVLRELQEELDAVVASFVEEKAGELELLGEEVMSMGIDESDASLRE